MARAELHLTPDEFVAFVKRVERLEAEGYRKFEIADILGVPRTTLYERLRRYHRGRKL
jgi:DNA-binding NtrC family response regulator